MSVSENPYWLSLDTLSKHLNLLNGMINHLEAQLGDYRGKTEKKLREKGLDNSILYSGSRLAITDLDGLSWSHFFIGSKQNMFKAAGEDYFLMIKALIERESAWTVSHGYEGFVAFLYDIVAVYLVNHYTSLDVNKLKELDKYNQRSEVNVKTDDIKYWRNYGAYLGPKKVLALIRSFDIHGEIARIERTNHRKINLQEWIEAVSLVRNATVHQFVIVSGAKLSSWPEQKLKMFKHFFPGENQEDGYALKFTVEHANESLKMLAEYAFIIFRGISRLHNYDFKPNTE